jgi:hypothetical protein
VQEDHQIPEALIEDSVTGAAKPNPELAQLAIYLRGDRKVRRWSVYRLPVQVLVDLSIDLCRPPGWQSVDEPLDRLHLTLVAVIGRLGPTAAAHG